MKRMLKHGWVPDLPDHRDHIFASATAPKTLPKSVDLRPKCPPVYDQGSLGSCTANAIAAAMEMDLKNLHHDVLLSRLFIYYNERAIEHSIESDSGASLRDGIKSISKLGACHEKEWPYSDANPGPFTEKPPHKAYDHALKHKVKSYARVQQSLTQMKQCLADGYPFVFGFMVYESFETDEVAETGIVHLPEPEELALGGHAVLAVGYSNRDQTFLVRNSWGEGWGKKGYFTMPYSYLTDSDLACDFWTVRAMVQ